MDHTTGNPQNSDPFSHLIEPYQDESDPEIRRKIQNRNAQRIYREEAELTDLKIVTANYGHLGAKRNQKDAASATSSIKDHHPSQTRQGTNPSSIQPSTGATQSRIPHDAELAPAGAQGRVQCNPYSSIGNSSVIMVASRPTVNLTPKHQYTELSYLSNNGSSRCCYCNQPENCSEINCPCPICHSLR
jgi:hypothetical protein